MTHHYDAIVLGAGPAGLTAGIYLSRSHVKTLIIDEGMPGGQMVLSHAIANYPGIPETSGAQIARNMVKQAKSFGAKIISQAEITSLTLTDTQKTITVTDEGTFTANAFIIATGGVPRTLGLESETAYKGKGISYCATCDGDFFTGKEIVAIGGGNSALEESVSLAKYASKVTVIHEFDHFQAHPWAVKEAEADDRIQFLMSQEVTGFDGDEKLRFVASRDKVTGEVYRVPAEGCFIFIGYIPNTAPFKDFVKLNDRGEILTDEHLATNIKGVFAAGDNREKQIRQITTAVADGTIAALSATSYLQDIRPA